MDVFNIELVKFWNCLNQNNVRYIMVGGVATNFNGYQRATDDVDLWLEDTIDNRKNLRKAFIDCEMGDYELLERIQFVPGWTSFRLNNGLPLDIMTTMKGLETFSFNECLQNAIVAEIENIKVPFLHINHLIANKKAVNRLKDQLDVIYLEKIKQLRDDNF
ncbi:MAG: hypothetical protein ACR2KB_14530 [Chitinophagaceae bacterium]